MKCISYLWLLTMMALASGCATVESDVYSTTPWASPTKEEISQGWSFGKWGGIGDHHP